MASKHENHQQGKKCSDAQSNVKPFKKGAEAAAQQTAAEDAAQAAEEAQQVQQDVPAEADAQSEMDALKAQCQDYLTTAQRLQAEFDNYRKRNETVRAQAYKDGQAEAVIELLPILDNLERAVEAARDSSDEALRSGVEMLLRLWQDTLCKMGITEIPAEGQPFDPNVHEAVMQVPPEEGQQSGMVMSVFRRGYRTEQRVLRHAMVTVTQ
nr:nucleotide exchange factor GrpE [Maliibacterium massiliense]